MTQLGPFIKQCFHPRQCLRRINTSRQHSTKERLEVNMCSLDLVKRSSQEKYDKSRHKYETWILHKDSQQPTHMLICFVEAAGVTNVSITYKKIHQVCLWFYFIISMRNISLFQKHKHTDETFILKKGGNISESGLKTIIQSKQKR